MGLHVDRVVAVGGGVAYVPNFSGETSSRARVGKIKKEMVHTT